ncbi:MAG: HEAT repeat domain-containing protein [Planctomycetes bacterium]|nr:HEAT repeat domain-containing protein [Planctomycetota bacterium]
MNLPRTLAALLLMAASALASPPEQKTSGKGLTYQIRLPDNYTKGKHPLVFALHGAGDNCADFMRWISSPESTLPKEAILVAPQALKDGAWDKEDLEPLAELIRDMKAAHAPTRTIGFGFSRGAYYTFHLGTTYPELYDGAIPHSGGLPGAVPDTETMRNLPFYVCHGDADNVVPVEQSEKAVAALEKAKVPVKFDKIAGLKHTVDWQAVKRGLEWINGILDERQKKLDDEVAAKITALEKSLKDKSWEAAAAGFAAITRVPAKLAPKLAALAKAHATSAEEAVALAAIAAAGRCGADGVAALKGIPGTNEKLAPAAAAALGETGVPSATEILLAYLKTKSDAVATAAAEALGKMGGDAATGALVSGLSNCEALLPTSPRKGAILEALKKITGQTFAKASEWKKWLAENAKK